MSCRETILSDSTYDFIVAEDESNPIRIAPVCIQKIDDEYSIYYYENAALPPLSIEDYSYTAIPKCFVPIDSTSLEVSGILALQNQPALSLKGKGIIVGIVDTGIDYTNPLFLGEDNSSRILRIWDQTDNTGESPEGFLYGTEYDKEEIDRALTLVNPLDAVPVMDASGHGTFLASVAAGGVDVDSDFTGAVPLAELVVVKLKQAKRYVREFFYYPQEELLYQENDVMAGVAYLESIAQKENKPLVLFIGLGSNQGSHTGSGPLSRVLSRIGGQQKRCVVVGAGNEAIARHHFYGNAIDSLAPVRAEINVEEGIEGFCMELWAFAPELVRVVVQSPTGQQSQGRFPLSQETLNTRFVFEDTTLSINYRAPGRESKDLLIFFRFTKPAAGIWTILIYPQITITGAFHIWLPMKIDALAGDVTFVRPNPDTTITIPADANVPISVGGYEALTGARYIESGRGFDARGDIKPDFCAPAVMVSGAGLRGNYVTYTGTSVAAAISAGACAQALEWGILKGNAPTMNSVEVKNLLIRGCNREDNLSYPNTEWGFGRLNIYQSFQNLRE